MAIQDIGETLASVGETRIHLCGKFSARINGQRIDEGFPGRQGRLLFANLVTRRSQSNTRAELAKILWPEFFPEDPEIALAALLAKLRKLVGKDLLLGKQDLQLVLPDNSWVDIEVAQTSLHRAESAISARDWLGAWGPAQVAVHISARAFMAGFEHPWVQGMRGRLFDVQMRANECTAASGFNLGGAELLTAERAARRVIELSPLRESACKLLMLVLDAGGNRAEALQAYERIRALLREQLGVSPGPALQATHRQLLQQ
jgi:SARP family transcriptional regulator, regulator of embCAB operon